MSHQARPFGLQFKEPKFTNESIANKKWSWQPDCGLEAIGRVVGTTEMSPPNSIEDRD